MIHWIWLLVAVVTVIVVMAIRNDLKERKDFGMFASPAKMWPIYLFSYLVFWGLIGLIFV